MRKTILLSICLCFVSINLVAQEIKIPGELKLENAEDYKKTEALVLQASEWLLETPVTEKADKRKELNTFLMQWISGSPSVSIALVEGIAPLDCPDCLMSFLSGWTTYSLKNDYSDDQVACAVAGAENAIAFYQKNKPILGRNADMEKLLKQQKKNKLKKYIQSKF